MAETIAKLVIKNTATALAEPVLEFLDHGELALNYYDGKLFYRDDVNVIQTIGTKSPASLLATQTFSGVNTFSNTINPTSVDMTIVTITPGANLTWNANDGNVAKVVLNSASTLTQISNIKKGVYTLRVTQDATGGRTLAFGSSFKTVDGDAIEIALGANQISILTFMNFGDGDVYVGSQQNFATPLSTPM